MYQVQGSTELISQPSITCNPSFILLFMDIKAATKQTCMKPSYYYKQQKGKGRNGGNFKTFIVNTLWREKTFSALNNNHCHQMQQHKGNKQSNHFNTFHETIKLVQEVGNKKDYELLVKAHKNAEPLIFVGN